MAARCSSARRCTRLPRGQCKEAILEKLTHDPMALQTVVLKAITRIFAAWGLSDDEAATLLDMAQPAWRGIKAGGWDVEIKMDQLLRISALMGIAQALEEFFGGPLIAEWITRPNTGPLFNGQRPVDRMLTQGYPAFLTILRYLEVPPGGKPIPYTASMHPAVAEAMAKARERCAEAAERILNAPDMLSVEEAAELMGASSEEVLRAVQDNTLLAIERDDHDPSLPNWQFDSAGRRRAGLAEALHIVGNGWPAYRFFATANQGITNRQRLMDGDAEGLRQSALLWISANYG